jgi:hypothetical protein
MAAKPKTYADYGYATATVKAIPELKSLMDKAIAGKWERQKFEGAVRNTKWWKQTTDAKRQFQVLEREKPAEAADRLSRRQNDLRAQATQMGVTVDDKWVRETARRSVSGNWDDNMIRRYMANNLRLATVEGDKQGGIGGQAAATVSRLRDQSAAYGVGLDQKTYQSWTQQILAGTRQPDDYEEFLRKTAKGTYVAIADDLDRGLSVEEVYSPYRQAAARILGVNEADIDLSNNKWKKPITHRGPDGKAVAMTVDQWEKTLRTDPQYGWENTPDAENQARLMAQQVKRAFGKGA